MAENEADLSDVPDEALIQSARDFFSRYAEDSSSYGFNGVVHARRLAAIVKHGSRAAAARAERVSSTTMVYAEYKAVRKFRAWLQACHPDQADGWAWEAYRNAIFAAVSSSGAPPLPRSNEEGLRARIRELEAVVARLEKELNEFTAGEEIRRLRARLAAVRRAATSDEGKS